MGKGRPRKKFHRNNLTVILCSIILVLIVVLVFAGYKLINKKESEKKDIVQYLTYTSEEYGYSFKYPSQWKLDVVRLKKGEDYNVDGKEYSVKDSKGNDIVKTIYKHSAFASYGDIELVILSRDDNWSIEMEAFKGIYKNCGGDSKLGKIDSKYKVLTLGSNYKIARPNFEEGNYRILADQGKYGDEEVPVTQPIQAYFDGVLDNGFDAYYLPLCISLTDIPLTLSIEYVSDTFTFENMSQGFKTDGSILKELDSVVESISLNKESTYLNTLK